MQIELYKTVKAELDNRIASGEKDLKIKYKNGIPTIVSLLRVQPSQSEN